MDQNNKGERLGVYGVSFIVRKAEKLTKALYMVSDILSDREPIKWKMREFGVELFSELTIALDASYSERTALMGLAIHKIERTIALLDIAEMTHMLTVMNASILKKEYHELKSWIEIALHEQSSTKRLFPDQFFDIKDETSFSLIHSPSRNEWSQGDISQEKNGIEELVKKNSTATATMDNKNTRNEIENYPNDNLSVSLNNDARGEIIPSFQSAPIEEKKDIQKTLPAEFVVRQDKENVLDQLIKETSVTVRNSESHSDALEKKDKEVGQSRREVILSTIKDKPMLTIKDISTKIVNVSEKTIQRELTSMVHEGILVRNGEKRWSTYSLR